MCGSFFKTGNKAKNRWSNLTREKLQKAIDDEKGLMFWNQELANRKLRLGVRLVAEDSTRERRYVCPDCVGRLLSDVSRLQGVRGEPGRNG